MYKPNFNITSIVLNNVSYVAELRAIIDRSKVLPLNEAQLRRQALVRMAHTSTSIEGNKLAEFQVSKVLAGQHVNADWKSIQEVRNYQDALKKLDDWLTKGVHLSIDTILELHELVVKDVIEKEKGGHFRSGDIYIVDDLGKGEEHIRYIGPDAKKVPFLINELLLWLKEADKQELHPMLKAGIFHSHFVNIHPFADGNGRMTRLLTQYLLYKESWEFKKIIVLEDYYNRNRQMYYDALKAASGREYDEAKEDLTGWLEYFTNGFLVEASKVGEQLSAIGFSQVSPEAETVFLDKAELQLMDFLTTTGRLTSNDVLDVLGVAKRTAQLKLKGLVDKGLLHVEGKGPATFYTLKK